MINRQDEFFHPALPEWARGELYRIQVREVTEYAMFILDDAGTLVSWNAGVERILGYAEADWIGQHASIIFTPRDKGHEICGMEMKIAAEQGSSSDVRWHVRKDGTQFFGNGCMTALRGEDGSLLGYTKIFSDETKNKELQDKLTESNAALEQFAYVASHDLQEPLRTVATYAELLVRRHGHELDSEAKSFLDLISGGAKRMSTLVYDLLDYARVRTEVDRPTSLSLDFDLETALTQLKTAIEESKAVVTHDPLPQVDADQGQMVRLFQNLVGNALKYRRPESVPVIHVTSQPQDGHWLVMIRDNGIGFDPKYAEEIFKPFKRLHSRQDYPGTGVGLAICRRIVETHGGRMWAESAAGEGATFYFTIPVGGKKPPHRTKSVIEDLL